MSELSARSRRRRGLRQDPAGRAAGDSAARHDQRPRVAPAALARRRAGPSRGHRRRCRDRRHDHAGGPGARRRADVRGARGGRLAPDETSVEVERDLARARRGAAARDASTRWRRASRSRRRRIRGRDLRRQDRPRREGAIDWTRAGRAPSTTSCAACSRGRSSSATARRDARCCIHRTGLTDERDGPRRPARSLARPAVTTDRRRAATAGRCGSSSSSPKGGA